jgi:uncharacterized protein YcgI (DUF1989 family)
MPLLMIDPDLHPLPQEQDVIIEGGGIAAFPVVKGQLLAIQDVEGRQPAALFAVAANNMDLVLSPHHTRVFSNSFMLRLGMRLVSNRRQPMMVLGVSAPHLRHDLLCPVTEAAVNGQIGGADRFRDKVRNAFRAVGAEPRKIADPINLFLGIDVNLDGSLAPRGATSKTNDRVVFRAVMDMVVAVAAPHADPPLWDRQKPGSIRVEVRNELTNFSKP